MDRRLFRLPEECDSLTDAEFFARLKARPQSAGSLRSAAPQTLDAWWRQLGRMARRWDLSAATTDGFPALWSQGLFEPTQFSDSLLRVLTSLSRPSGTVRRSIRGRANGRQSRPSAVAKPRRTSAGRKPSPGPHRHADGGLSAWIARRETSIQEAASPFELLLLGDCLLELARRQERERAVRLGRLVLRLLADTAGDGRELPDAADDAPNRLRELIVAGEIPYRCGLIFAGLKGAESARRRGRSVLIETLLDETDTDGTPDAPYVERLDQWLAPWVRAAQLARAARTALFTEDAAERFRDLVRFTIAGCLPDGHLAASGAKANGRHKATVTILQEAARCAGLPATTHAARYLQALAVRKRRNGTAARKTPSRRNNKAPARPPFPSVQSDWAEVAMLRSDWSEQADLLVLTHDRTYPQMELAALGRPVLDGAWRIALTVDDQPVELDDEWACTCWQSDRDGDYLELQMRLAGGLRIERQLLLARRERFLCLADTAIGARGERVALTSWLPLAEGVAARRDRQTREWRLRSGTVPVRLLPLDLPQYPVDGTAGVEPLSLDGCSLRQHRQVHGTAAQLAVVLEWHPQRRRLRADWRSLTVTETGRIVSPHAALGYRWRIGGDQWLWYRSLRRSPHPRAVLGHHTMYETVIGRFDTQGEVDALVLIE